MPRIRCHYIDCVFIDDGYCSAAAVEFDPDVGCMTFSRVTDLEDGWDDPDEELEDWDDVDLEEDDDELWIGEDDF